MDSSTQVATSTLLPPPNNEHSTPSIPSQQPTSTQNPVAQPATTAPPTATSTNIADEQQSPAVQKAVLQSPSIKQNSANQNNQHQRKESKSKSESPLDLRSKASAATTGGLRASMIGKPYQQQQSSNSMTVSQVTPTNTTRLSVINEGKIATPSKSSLSNNNNNSNNSAVVTVAPRLNRSISPTFKAKFQPKSLSNTTNLVQQQQQQQQPRLGPLAARPTTNTIHNTTTPNATGTSTISQQRTRSMIDSRSLERSSKENKSTGISGGTSNITQGSTMLSVIPENNAASKQNTSSNSTVTSNALQAKVNYTNNAQNNSRGNPSSDNSINPNNSNAVAANNNNNNNGGARASILQRKPNAPAPPQYQEPAQLKFYVGGGNNGERIRKLMSKREGWVESVDGSSMMVHLKWQQSSRGYKFEKLIENGSYRQVVNHFEFHHLITNKQNLIRNLLLLGESVKENAFALTPITYIIDFTEDTCDSAMNGFLKSFEADIPAHLRTKVPHNATASKIVDIRRLLRVFQATHGQSPAEKVPLTNATKWSLTSSFLDPQQSTYMWLLKPTFLNRGRGINVFNNLTALEKLFAEYTEGFEEKSLSKKKDEKQSQQQQPQPQAISNSQSMTSSSAAAGQTTTIDESEEISNNNNNRSSTSTLTNHSQSMTKLPIENASLAGIVPAAAAAAVDDASNSPPAGLLNENRRPSGNYFQIKKVVKPAVVVSQQNSNLRVSSVQPNTKIGVSGSKVGNSATTIGMQAYSGNNNNNAAQKSGQQQQQQNAYFSQQQQQQQQNNQYAGIKKEKEDPNKYIRTIPMGPCILKASQFVIQKYIEKPLLISQRKFDIRVWALLTHNLDVYFFSEGYMRLSSSEFTTDEKQLDNLFIHLTNNAIQKYSDTYGTFENGNMWNFNKLWAFIEANQKPSSSEEERLPAEHFKRTIVNKMKDIIWLTFCSVKKKINSNERKFCFEMFGFDFLLDENLHPWLIEVNTNPAIEECSLLLQSLVPRAIDDAFKLTVDAIFPQKRQAQFNNNQNKNKQQQSQSNTAENNETDEYVKTVSSLYVPPPQATQSMHADSGTSPKKPKGEPEFYSVPGYEDTVNMWDHIGNLKDATPAQIKKVFSQFK